LATFFWQRVEKIYSDITGIILAGGENRRMKLNKSLLEINSVTLIERTRNLLQNIFDKVIISSKDIEEYSFLNLNVVKDVYEGFGPLSGIHAALNVSSTELNFFISCDLPLMSEEMIRYIIGSHFSEMILVPSAGGKIQHTCGVYKKELIPIINSIHLQAGNRKNEKGKYDSSIRKLILEAGAKIIEVDSLPFYNDDLFFNMNTKADFEYLRNKFQV